MNWKELATLKNAHAKRLELIEFQKQLKETLDKVYNEMFARTT